MAQVAGAGEQQLLLLGQALKLPMVGTILMLSTAGGMVSREEHLKAAVAEAEDAGGAAGVVDEAILPLQRLWQRMYSSSSRMMHSSSLCTLDWVLHSQAAMYNPQRSEGLLSELLMLDMMLQCQDASVPRCFSAKMLQCQDASVPTYACLLTHEVANRHRQLRRLVQLLLNSETHTGQARTNPPKCSNVQVTA